MNVACYETRAFEDCRFEAHKKYIDVQLMVEGVERIDSQFVGELASEPFDEAADNAFLNGEACGVGHAERRYLRRLFPQRRP